MGSDDFRAPLKKHFEEGGRDKEGVARKTGEATLPSHVNVGISSPAYLQMNIYRYVS